MECYPNILSGTISTENHLLVDKNTAFTPFKNAKAKRTSEWAQTCSICVCMGSSDQRRLVITDGNREPVELRSEFGKRNFFAVLKNQFKRQK